MIPPKPPIGRRVRASRGRADKGSAKSSTTRQVSMAGLCPTPSAFFRAVLVVPPCVAALLTLLICWGAYSEDHAHLEHDCFTEEEFVSDLPPYEQALFRLAGNAGVTGGYTFAAVGIIAFGASICRPRPAKRKNGQNASPPLDKAEHRNAQRAP